MKFIITIIFILISLSILTLYERKIIGISQGRTSPQEAILNGTIQPLLDALKLLNKEMKMIEKKIQNNIYLIMFCLIMFYINMFFWLILPLFAGEETNFRLNMVMFLVILSISIYPIIFLSFFSHSKYPFMSLLRMISQSISYEINFSLVVVLILMISQSYNNHMILFFSKYSFFPLVIIMLILIMISIIESFRSPFDYTESESELVSGFTSEVGSLKFTFIFMSEYSLMIFYMMFISYFFSFSMFFLIFLTTMFFFMFSRSVLPRLRYDFLMSFCWINLFPLMILFFFIS